ncbi:acetyl-CoA sensor PanZ family protein [Marinospirillum sp.]|uniref:acetyl-CoA sensor PanZ family protein n=1 Tax=Marinospirillum sp. TaxID=2183934 RepID=UPI003A889A30
MPVLLRKIDTTILQQEPGWQTDLHKIYSEAEPERRCLKEVPLEVEPFIAQALSLEGRWFAGALFNDHLIGAALVSPVREDEWQVRHLCVRAVTRRRGVASRLMALIAAQAQQQGVVLVVPDAGLSLADQVLVGRLGCQRCPERQGFVFHSTEA